MAVVTTKSAQVTNRDATPNVLNNPNQGAEGRVRSVFGKVAAVNGDSVASKYIFTGVPSNARVDKVRLYSAAFGVGAATDVGVYRNTDDGGAVVDADFFGSAIDISAAVNGTEISHESGVYTIAKREQPLWQAVGLSADPRTTLDIVATLTGAAAASGDVGVYVDFVV